MITKEFMATVYVVENGKILFVFNNNVNNWIPLGGHVEPNELPCSAAIREAKEESGLDIKIVQDPDAPESTNIMQPRHIHLDHLRDDHKHINLMYFGRVVGGEQKEISDENTELRWFSKKEIEKTKTLIPEIREWALKAVEELS